VVVVVVVVVVLPCDWQELVIGKAGELGGWV
jgi:hypothetical protein